MPWNSSDAYGHTHKASSPTAQRQWSHVANGALEHGASEKSAIMQANGVVARRRAMGGSALDHVPMAQMPKLTVAHPSPLAQIAGQHFGSISHPAGNFAAHARMPRVPIMDTMRNIGQKVHFDDGGEAEVRNSSSPGSPGFLGAVRDALASLKDYVIDRPAREQAAARQAAEGQAEQGDESALQQGHGYAKGGAMMHPAALRALQQAMQHLKNMDASSAAATLRASPAAMFHPDIRAAEAALRTSQGVAPAQRTLATLGNANGASRLQAPPQ